ncbi:MAG: hypothetical protein US76_04235 [Parcubacteria group bacterium GW2011_GWA2_38_13b]|nr:MAG: hypothetical protein US76_04235 [Parcubacteria group bacterium GW2011_GWA2_38_13b]
MRFVSVNKEKFFELVNLLIKQKKERIVGVVKKDDDYIFNDLENAVELCLDYGKPTLLPPGKKYLLPRKETLLKFQNASSEIVNEAKPITLIGVHPYDLWAIKVMNAVFLSEPIDRNYAEKRKNMFIIGVDYLNPHPNSFCASIGTYEIHDGFDLLLTDIGKKYIITIDSEKGEKFIDKYIEFTKEATAIDLLFLDNAVNKAKEKYKLAMPLKKEELPKFLEDKYDNPLWTELAKKCFSCGKCNLVCPTCVCFNIEDKAELNLQEGVREREWHGCALKEFAEVAMGHNFRGKIEQRLRHRIYRKLSYTVSRYGIYGCVGCGRCINSCKAGIASPVEIIKKLNKE